MGLSPLLLPPTMTSSPNTSNSSHTKMSHGYHHQSCPRSPPLTLPNEYKYFHEPGVSDRLGHYDARYFRGLVFYEKPAASSGSSSSPNSPHSAPSASRPGSPTAPCWGGGGTVLPPPLPPPSHPIPTHRDFNLDVQLSTTNLSHLAAHHSRKTHTHIYPVPASSLLAGDDEDVTHPNTTTPRRTKRYLLDINPFHAALDRGRGLNMIGALDRSMFPTAWQISPAPFLGIKKGAEGMN
ncbi:hypothetical protein B0T25DRAFT_615750 [Lasiosphaeria hispida]|uniref:Uncharacterized protein n=1 Tax=Lasiosphaeria hispida TaxID=260671 RepID=A0AAJ0H995_9PEZI|nr:hypothetical protein B0T25DRAFT_615750 [Lasiosphaeria hispida]